MTGVFVDISFFSVDHGEVSMGSHGHQCADYVAAELWLLQWQQSHPDVVFVGAVVTEVPLSQERAA